MRLSRFRVTNFRSINDSGWIDCENVTTLVGVNEAGKSNVILALWKLNPARGGEIDILHDLPTESLSILREKTKETCFIEAYFEVDRLDVQNFVDSHEGIEIKELSCIECKRYFDGHREWGVNEGASFINLVENDEQSDDDKGSLSASEEMSDEERAKCLLEMIPTFVYYSNYGNLSSHVYLPYAEKWIRGEVVQGIEKNDDQVRTLKELFDFVHLNPSEVLELGKDPKEVAWQQYAGRQPTKEEIEKAESNKQERTILLNSAGDRLTHSFREWWRQGNYVFRLGVDGDYLTIWVRDELRPTEVDLKDRSTGLQWFLSFFLVFLVEAEDSNEGAVLLLDEAGLSLHPKAQHDLIEFMNELSKENQIIHTTHSPFLIDTNNVDRCVAVYVDENGYTVASNNLRDGAGQFEQNSIYAVHAALGLSVSDVMLSGCFPVVVEGPSDQYALSAIKQKLIQQGRIKPSREIVFLPAGGNKAINAVSSIVGATDGLPTVLLDGDNSGKNTAKNLRSSQYSEEQDKVVVLSELFKSGGMEIEDLMPYPLISKFIDRKFLMVEDEDFVERYDENSPIVDQIEAFAKRHNIILEPGKWKVDMAKWFKRQLLSGGSVDNETLEQWETLFKAIVPE